ncbi:MAG: hypothetical protein QM235_06900 [Pseudomonadota bacterium]|nr:hypothetical protein [Pseudomonadota bacterium]
MTVVVIIAAFGIIAVFVAGTINKGRKKDKKIMKREGQNAS